MTRSTAAPAILLAAAAVAFAGGGAATAAPQGSGGTELADLIELAPRSHRSLERGGESAHMMAIVNKRKEVVQCLIVQCRVRPIR